MGIQHLFGESSQRTDCVASFLGCYPAFCVFLYGRQQKAGWDIHGNEATGTVCSGWAEEFAAGYHMHVALFPDLLKVHVLIIYSMEKAWKFFT